MDLETIGALKDDEAEVHAFLAENGGVLQGDAEVAVASEDTAEHRPGVPGRYWLSMRPLSNPTERYYPCVTWTVYPHHPPSVKFAQGIGGSLTVTSAWPVIPGYRPTSFDICMPFTAEGSALHSEWARGPHAWRPTGNPFLSVVQQLQSDLNDRYGGRSA